MTIVSVLVGLAYFYVAGAFIYLDGSLLASRLCIERANEEQDLMPLMSAHDAIADAVWFPLWIFRILYVQLKGR